MKVYFVLILSYTAFAEADSVKKTLHTANIQLTSRMFPEVVKENQNKSVVLSAFSTIAPLSQLAIASEGPSRDELLNAMGLPDDNTLNSVLTLIDTNFSTFEGVKLKMASKLYIPQDHEVDTTITASKNVYHSKIADIDFTDSEKSVNKINGWVKNQTNERIGNLINADAVTPTTQGLLVNAVYLKGYWKYSFNEDATLYTDFYVNKEETSEVLMMLNTQDHMYKESEKLQSKILELPNDGDQSSFIFVLPNDEEGIGQLIDKLKDPNILDEETRDMKNVEVRVNIPKFEIETSINLKEILMNINVTKIFGNDANLTRLSKIHDKLFVAEAVQKVFIEIDEEGVELADPNPFTTAINSDFWSDMYPSFDFIADHPFAFFLKIQDEILVNGVFYG